MTEKQEQELGKKGYSEYIEDMKLLREIISRRKNMWCEKYREVGEDLSRYVSNDFPEGEKNEM